MFPAQRGSPASTVSPSRTKRRFAIGMKCWYSRPNESLTVILRLPLAIPSNNTTPETLASSAGLLGLRASNSSLTRGRPEVMSIARADSLSILAMVRPALILSPSSTWRIAPPGRWYEISSLSFSSMIWIRGCLFSSWNSVMRFWVLPVSSSNSTL